MNIEKHAADILLDRGVSWPVPAPWFLRIFGKKKIKISVKALKLGTLYELSGLYASMGIISQEDLNKDPHGLIRNHIKTICRIAAICILNSRTRIRLFSKPLALFIFKRFTANMLLEVMLFIATFSGVSAFINTIGLIGDLKITTPKDPSPTDQGSQQK